MVISVVLPHCVPTGRKHYTTAPTVKDHALLTLSGPSSGSTVVKGEDEECGEESNPSL